MVQLVVVLLQRGDRRWVMTPDDFRSQIHTLQQAIETLLDGWTLVVCSSD